MPVRLEYLGEDKEYPNARDYAVEAIHVTTTRNKRKFTEAELNVAARSLSFRHININHDPERTLKFPENATLAMHYEKARQAVIGRIRIADPSVQAQIESGYLSKVSIEQIPTLGEQCNEILCEQHGVAFIGMALLEEGVPPGDPTAGIRLESYQIKDAIVPNAQRECHDCTDWQKCHRCAHAEDCVSDAVKEIKSAHPDWERDRVIAVALSKCDKSQPEMATVWYEYIKPRYESIN